jgi:hypothetical protein
MNSSLNSTSLSACGRAATAGNADLCVFMEGGDSGHQRVQQFPESTGNE